MAETPHWAYTYNSIERNLLLLVTHLRELGRQPRDFCTDCIKKHAAKIAGFAEEAMSFVPEGRNIWPKLEQWAQDIRSTIDTMTVEQAEKKADEGRLLWKEISKIPRSRQQPRSHLLSRDPGLLCPCIGQPDCECDIER